jgi:hypothetical protein
MYFAPDRPVKYVDRLAACAYCPTAWSDRPVMYLDCPALCADSRNCSFRIWAGRGGLGAHLVNLVLKTGPTTISLDGPHSRADGPVMRRSMGLLPICIGGCDCRRYVSISIP